MTATNRVSNAHNLVWCRCWSSSLTRSFLEGQFFSYFSEVLPHFGYKRNHGLQISPTQGASRSFLKYPFSQLVNNPKILDVGQKNCFKKGNSSEKSRSWTQGNDSDKEVRSSPTRKIPTRAGLSVFNLSNRPKPLVKLIAKLSNLLNRGSSKFLTIPKATSPARFPFFFPIPKGSFTCGCALKISWRNAKNAVLVVAVLIQKAVDGKPKHLCDEQNSGKLRWKTNLKEDWAHVECRSTSYPPIRWSLLVDRDLPFLFASPHTTKLM